MLSVSVWLSQPRNTTTLSKDTLWPVVGHKSVLSACKATVPAAMPASGGDICWSVPWALGSVDHQTVMPSPRSQKYGRRRHPSQELCLWACSPRAVDGGSLIADLGSWPFRSCCGTSVSRCVGPELDNDVWLRCVVSRPTFVRTRLGSCSEGTEVPACHLPGWLTRLRERVSVKGHVFVF